MQIQDLKLALESGDLEKAKSIFYGFVNTELSEKEAGKILLDLTMLHVQSENVLNKLELAFLDEAIKEIKALGKLKSEKLEELEKAELKDQIQSS